jgi:flagellar basal-body rod modification protein FlgD
MAIQALGGVSTPQTASIAQNTVSEQDFLQILLTQLNFQDPLKPLDNEQFVAELAQFTTLEQTQQLSDNVTTLLSIQSATQSVGLIGRTVDVSTSNGSVTGSVTAIDFSTGQAQLTVTETDGTVLTGVGLSQVTLVQ